MKNRFVEAIFSHVSIDMRIALEDILYADETTPKLTSTSSRFALFDKARFGQDKSVTQLSIYSNEL